MADTQMLWPIKMRAILCILFLFSKFLVLSQPGFNDVEIIYQIVNYFDSTVQFEYYYPEEPINESLNEYSEYPYSIFGRFDPESYEWEYESGFYWDSVLTKMYEYERSLFQLRLDEGRDLIVVGKTRPEYVHRISRPEISDIDDLVITELLNSFNNHSDTNSLIINGLNERCDQFQFELLGSKEIADKRYLIKAFVAFSEIVYDKNNEYAVVEFGYHHRIHNGTTGHGMHVYLRKIDNKWKIVHIAGLWEE